MNVLDKVLLVTGASRGIGAGVAERAARAGYAVAVNYLSRRDAAEAVVDRIVANGGRALAVAGDVGREADVVAMFRAVDGELRPLAALVNSAGIHGGHRLTRDFDAGELTAMMATNVVGTMICCREAVRRMSTARGGTGGAIVNVSSMAATIGGRPGKSHYGTTKGAVDAYTIGLAKEVAREGIRVNAVRPGMTYTDMIDGVRGDAKLDAEMRGTIPINRIAEVDEVADPILYLLSDAASFVTGTLFDISGGGFALADPHGGG